MAKYKTKGLIAKIGASASPTTAIIQLGDSSLELGERDGLIQATTHDTNSGTHEFLDPGFKAPASFTGEILYDPADSVHEVIRSAHDAGTTLYLELTIPSTPTKKFAFSLRVRNASLPLPVMGKLTMSVTLEGLAGTTVTSGT